MSKKLQTHTIVNELEGSAFFPKKAPQQVPEKGHVLPQEEERVISETTNQPVSQPIGQSTSRSADQLTSQTTGGLVERPKSFYITRRLDKRLDDAVRYFQEHHSLKRADRSTIVNAILDNDAVWSDESLDRLVDRVIAQLTSRLVK